MNHLEKTQRRYQTLPWYKTLGCNLSGHEWTCAAEQGESAPTKEESESVMQHFNRYATMYCSRCGHVYRRK